VDINISSLQAQVIVGRRIARIVMERDADFSSGTLVSCAVPHEYPAA
jgi:hypothetical protein